VETVIIGGSIAGYSLTPRKLKPTIPSRTMKRLSTVAPIGLFKAISEMVIMSLF
jgi:hypothetical protein